MNYVTGPGASCGRLRTVKIFVLTWERRSICISGSVFWLLQLCFVRSLKRNSYKFVLLCASVVNFISKDKALKQVGLHTIITSRLFLFSGWPTGCWRRSQFFEACVMLYHLSTLHFYLTSLGVSNISNLKPHGRKQKVCLKEERQHLHIAVLYSLLRIFKADIKLFAF